MFGQYYGEPICYSTTWLYNGPSHAVAEVAGAVMASGKILSITPPSAVNTSYDLQFTGPSLSCNRPEPDIISQIQKILADFYAQDDFADTYGYLAWVRVANDSEISPFVAGSNSSNASSLTWFPGHGPAPELYVGIFPNLFTIEQVDVNTYDLNATTMGDDIHRCEFRNATYRVSFNYTGSEQDVRINAIEELEAGQPIQTFGSQIGPDPTCVYENVDSPGCLQCCSLCNWDDFPFRTLSYQAVIESFLQDIKGRVGSSTTYDYRSVTTKTTVESNVLSTVMRNAPNIAFLQQTPSENYSLSTAWKKGSGQHVPQVEGLLTQTHDASPAPFTDMLEQLFANFTISLMSSPALQYVTSANPAICPRTDCKQAKLLFHHSTLAS